MCIYACGRREYRSHARILFIVAIIVLIILHYLAVIINPACLPN